MERKDIQWRDELVYLFDTAFWIAVKLYYVPPVNFMLLQHLFPVVGAKADSVYCLQGLTAGDNQPIQRVKLHWTAKDLEGTQGYTVTVIEESLTEAEVDSVCVLILRQHLQGIVHPHHS